MWPNTVFFSWNNIYLSIYLSIYLLLRSLSDKYPLERYKHTYPPSITGFLLEWRLWHWITQEDWYAIKQRNQAKHLYIYVYVYVCVCVCSYIHTHIYVSVYIHPRITYTYTYTSVHLLINSIPLHQHLLT